MSVTCFIRYEIDPFQRAAFKAYAENWGKIIPRCGGHDELRKSGTLPYDPARITTPTLIIQGEWDAVTPPSQSLWLFEHFGSRLKRFVVLSGGGHRLHLEQSRLQLYEEVRVFLQDKG